MEDLLVLGRGGEGGIAAAGKAVHCHCDAEDRRHGRYGADGNEA